MLRRFTALCLATSLFLSTFTIGGCAGRAANVVPIYQQGDEQRSCESIEAELRETQDEILRLIPQADKTARNWILGTAGFFLLVPYFFMDLSRAEQQEVNSFRHRYNYLLDIAKSHGCVSVRMPLPDFSDKATMKKFYEEKKTLFPVAVEALAV